MNNPMKYKGYYGLCKLSVENNIFHGKIEYINDLVTYEASTSVELEAAFHDAVDDYLETYGVLGKEPDKTMSDSFAEIFAGLSDAINHTKGQATKVIEHKPMNARQDFHAQNYNSENS